MPKRAVQFLVAGGLGALLAWLVIWIASPGRDSDELFQTPVPSSAAAPVGARVSVEPEVPAPQDRVGSQAEGRLEPLGSPAADPEAGTESARIQPLREPDARARALAGDLGTRASSPSESPLPSDDPNDAEEFPLGWCFQTTLNTEAVSDAKVVWNGSRSILIRKHEGPTPAYMIDTLWQVVDATPYRGRRLELSVHVRTRGSIMLFLQPATQTELTQATGSLRTTSPTNEHFNLASAEQWTGLAVVADIPADADVLYYGVAHNGSVEALWADDVRLEDVGRETPITEGAGRDTPIWLPINRGSVLPEPTNLDFELTSATATTC